MAEQIAASPAAPRFVVQKAMAWLEHNRLECVPFRIAAGKLEIREHEIGFRCMVDKKLIDCTISHRVLLDLASAYGLSHQMIALAAFGELLSPIEKIASRKYEAGRLEENGALKIGTADLLRYGSK
jgi:hypothetical protein